MRHQIPSPASADPASRWPLVVKDELAFAWLDGM
jgi:hypothetical protein